MERVEFFLGQEQVRSANSVYYVVRSVMTDRVNRLVDYLSNEWSNTSTVVFCHSEIERVKARYIAKGFEKVYGVDLFETWAPVGRYATLRALLSICVVWDLETKHIDIKCAFLNGVLHQDVYIVQPPMFHDGTRRVWKLKKALYGLKQAAREWHKALVELLSEIGFNRCHSDPALFVSRVGTCFIFLWVDDLLIIY